VELVKLVGKLKHCVWITCVHLEDLHCLLAHFPGLIYHYLVSKIKKNNNKFKKKKIIFFIFIFLLTIILFYVFTCKCYFVISVSGLVLHAFT